MTSNRGAGFSSNPRGRFDPLNQGGKSALGASGGSSSSLLPKRQEPSVDEVGMMSLCCKQVSCGSSTCLKHASSHYRHWTESMSETSAKADWAWLWSDLSAVRRSAVAVFVTHC